MKTLPTLYSRSSKGALREWIIEFKDDSYRTHSGQVGGKIVTSNWYSAEATNIGRANERSLVKQAEFEATAKWQKKVDEGYTTDIDNVDTSTLFVEPMLAKKWEDRCEKILSDQSSWPLYTQPKLDGMRCIITKNGATSRNGKKWHTVNHILKELEQIFVVYPDLVLDGELYNHEYKHDFNKICSLAKRTKPSENDLKEAAEKLQFHWYDIVDTKHDFTWRTQFICDVYDTYPLSNCIQPVQTSEHYKLDTINNSYTEYMSLGYEGQMIRIGSAEYECKRSSSLLKRKEFNDSEYKIVDICEGNGNKLGMAGYAILELDNGTKFHSNIKGQHEFLKELLVNRDKYIRTYGTCTYFNLTPDGIPRFPYLTKLREGKGID